MLEASGARIVWSLLLLSILRQLVNFDPREAGSGSVSSADFASHITQGIGVSSSRHQFRICADLDGSTRSARHLIASSGDSLLRGVIRFVALRHLVVGIGGNDNGMGAVRFLLQALWFPIDGNVHAASDWNRGSSD